MTVVLIHKDMGIYLGGCMGLGFFSMLDCAGQDHACLFDSAEQAHIHVASWETPFEPGDYWTVEVVAAEQWATIEELDAAGLTQYTGSMKLERLRQMVAEGSA